MTIGSSIFLQYLFLSWFFFPKEEEPTIRSDPGNRQMIDIEPDKGNRQEIVVRHENICYHYVENR